LVVRVIIGGRGVRILLLVVPVIVGGWGLRLTGDSRVRRSGDGQARADDNTIRCFSMSFTYSVCDKQGKCLEGGPMNQTNRIFLYNDLVMYELPYGFATGTMGREPDTSETRYSYFIYRRDSSMGVEYDLHYPDSVRHRRADSVLRGISGFKDEDKSGFFDRTSSPLLYKSRDAANGNLMEVYLLGDSGHIAPSDTLWLFYSDRYGMLPGSLLARHDRDSLPKMRLVRMRARFVIPPEQQRSIQNGFMPDHGEINWKIQETAFFNRDSAMMFFGKYEGYCGAGGGRK